jgi:hypothetical protein
MNIVVKGCPLAWLAFQATTAPPSIHRFDFVSARPVAQNGSMYVAPALRGPMKPSRTPFDMSM